MGGVRGRLRIVRFGHATGLTKFGYLSALSWKRAWVSLRVDSHTKKATKQTAEMTSGAMKSACFQPCKDEPPSDRASQISLNRGHSEL